MLICKHCFLDAEMQSEVEANATSEGACDVCHKQGKVIDSSEFADFFEALLSLFERSDAGKPVAEMEMCIRDRCMTMGIQLSNE